jgi:hypothetical protein
MKGYYPVLLSLVIINFGWRFQLRRATAWSTPFPLVREAAVHPEVVGGADRAALVNSTTGRLM